MSETALKIRVYGNPVLRKKARAVRTITPVHRDILSKMARLMYEAEGIGLAAPQVGINESMIVADIGNSLYKLINPRVTKKEGHQVTEEGCLSVPGICIKVKRAMKVVVEAEDENSKPAVIEAEGLLACVLQHEIDHLKGKLIVDYASFFKKINVRRQLEGLKKRSINEELYEPKTKSCKLQL